MPAKVTHPAAPVDADDERALSADTAPGDRGGGLPRGKRDLVITLAGVLAVVFAFVASNVAASHQPKPHGLPVGIVGSQQVVGGPAGRLDAPLRAHTR
jgi:hypothetical protein